MFGSLAAGGGQGKAKTMDNYAALLSKYYGPDGTSLIDKMVKKSKAITDAAADAALDKEIKQRVGAWASAAFDGQACSADAMAMQSLV